MQDTIETSRAAQFARTVENMVSGRTLRVGTDVVFGLGPATIEGWRARPEVWIFQGIEIDDTLNGYSVIRTVGVQRGGEKTWEVIGDGHSVLGETRGLGPALSIALDYVSAPARAVEALAELDPYSC